MLARCPVCRAEKVQEPRCRRCKADLSPLFALEEQRNRMLAEARHSLLFGQYRQAARWAEAADWLRGDESSRRLAALAHLLGRDFAAALRMYQRMR